MKTVRCRLISKSEVVKKVMKMNVERISRRRRQKKRWLDVVRSDIIGLLVCM